MQTAVDAIYEHGHLRLLHPLPLPENTPVRVVIELPEADAERNASLVQSERRLRAVWDNASEARAALATDWPQFRGPHRDGTWDEKGILESFPREGLNIRWKQPVGGGWSSPVGEKHREGIRGCGDVVPAFALDRGTFADRFYRSKAGRESPRFG